MGMIARPEKGIHRIIIIIILVCGFWRSVHKFFDRKEEKKIFLSFKGLCAAQV